jgi:hypothetical protein
MGPLEYYALVKEDWYYANFDWLTVLLDTTPSPFGGGWYHYGDMGWKYFYCVGVGWTDYALEQYTIARRWYLYAEDGYPLCDYTPDFSATDVELQAAIDECSALLEEIGHRDRNGIIARHAFMTLLSEEANLLAEGTLSILGVE